MTQRFVLPNKLLLFGGQFPKKITCNFRKKEKRKTKPIMRGVRALRADGLNTSSTPFSFLSFLFYLPSSRLYIGVTNLFWSGQHGANCASDFPWLGKNQMVQQTNSVCFPIYFVVFSWLSYCSLCCVVCWIHSYDRQNWFLPTSPPG